MNASYVIFPDNHTSRMLGMISAMVGAVLLSISTPPVRGDIPDASPSRFGGFYKVTSSNDPIFPVTKTREYFLDFGKGIQGGKLSGSVAVSVRMNPNVKVRIMSWEYFPDQDPLLIGNPFAHGSRNAVAAGAWQLKGSSDGVVLRRGTYQVVLTRADPGE
jgi:hypothetical protein